MKVEEVIGRNLLRIREERGLSQAELGQAVEPHLGRPWSRQAVSAAEKGRRSFTAADLLALARILNTSVPALFLAAGWGEGSTVELADGISVGMEEYRERILHDSDVHGASQLMTQADIQDLGASVLKIRAEHIKAGGAIQALLISTLYAAKASGLNADPAGLEELITKLGEVAAEDGPLEH
ncbi:helix-turn-helix transcriptional regulator [Streptomyces odonnellii]|uniref:helix-turn-helix transcriptional regulator n=1 Tax=Streptomyces odonnellii TaxID=1417980 RepID=UPI000626A93B|nr:helix-turn-helix transcriptional regulator [Streptomyces odonnellii]